MTTADTIIAAYLAETKGDAQEALKRLAADALADLAELERRTGLAERLCSRGFRYAAIREKLAAKAPRKVG